MKTGLDHLPAGKRRELANVQTVLMEEFERRSRLGFSLVIAETSPVGRKPALAKFDLLPLCDRPSMISRNPERG